MGIDQAVTAGTRDASEDFQNMFSDPEAVARYAEGPRRFVPGFEALHRMTAILLAERAPADATVLVLGAGGGLELKALAEAHEGWRFVGVDPAGPMLDLARRTMGPMAPRAKLIEGYVEAAPEGPFDAGTCLLTLHFLDQAARLSTLREIRRRLRPGAPFVAAHSSFPQDRDARATWLLRYAAFAVASGADAEMAKGAREAVAANLHLLSPQDDEALLRDSGFSGVEMFYAAFSWRGWIAYA